MNLLTFKPLNIQTFKQLDYDHDYDHDYDYDYDYDYEHEHQGKERASSLEPLASSL